MTFSNIEQSLVGPGLLAAWEVIYDGSPIESAGKNGAILLGSNVIANSLLSPMMNLLDEWLPATLINEFVKYNLDVSQLAGTGMTYAVVARYVGTSPVDDGGLMGLGKSTLYAATFNAAGMLLTHTML